MSGDVLSMKILLIGPGQGIPIPCTGHGAVEHLIYEYYKELSSLGHEVQFTNAPNLGEIIQTVNNGNFDVVHLHYDCFYTILPCLKAKLVINSSHYPYINMPDRFIYDNYQPIFKWMVENSQEYPIAAISDKDREIYLKNNVRPQDVFVIKNGASHQDFTFTENASKPDRSIYLGKIEPRKGQCLVLDNLSIDFVGRGHLQHPNFLGELPDDWKFNHLTDYANIVLLSYGENASPLVLKEAMMCGLGIVCSEEASSELPYDMPWINVLSRKYIESQPDLSIIIDNNRKQAIKYRKEIRKYAIENWSWKDLIKTYEMNLKKILENRSKLSKN